MQLFYYRRRDQQPNFGDELNRWLWQQALPDLLQAQSDTALVGIGTLLNSALPQRLEQFRQVRIFSTGAGYEKPLAQVPANWKIYALRGPLSARQLGLPASLALSDGGILLRRWYQPAGQKQWRFAVMPHVHHASFAADYWQQLCSELGFGYIDPRWPVDQVLTAISQTQVLIAEAMHGAIAADALRVPWMALTTSPRILAFKWRDWCASVNLPYQPQYFPPLAYPSYARGLRSGSRNLLHWARLVQQRPTLSLSPTASGCRCLQAIAQTTPPQLSRLSDLEAHCDTLSARLDQLRHEALKG